MLQRHTQIHLAASCNANFQASSAALGPAESLHLYRTHHPLRNIMPTTHREGQRQSTHRVLHAERLKFVNSLKADRPHVVHRVDHHQSEAYSNISAKISAVVGIQHMQGGVQYTSGESVGAKEITINLFV